jgi:transcriptional regulator with XRE-family HTH domain
MIKNNIARELKKAEKSQAWLASFTGISTGMVSQLVSGRSIPTAPELMLICAAFLCKPEDLYAPDMVSLIKGTEKPEKEGAKSYRGKHVLLTDQLADDVDEYAARYGLTRNEAARTLIIIGLRETTTLVEGIDQSWIEEVMRHGETTDITCGAAPSDV